MATLILLGLLLVPFVLVGACLSFFWRKKRPSIVRWSFYLYAIAAVVVILGAGPYLLAWMITHARTRPPDMELRETPARYGVAFEEIMFEARDSLRLRGWFIPPTRRNAVLICTHGLFRNRIEMLDRAMAAARVGYGALLYDSRSHGSSERGTVSLGYYEKNDVLGAIQYVQRRYQDSPDQPRIVLMGISMGAMATLGAAAESKGYSAMVLDSPFESLRQTTIDHAWLFLKLPRYPFPSMFLFWFEHFAEFSPDRLDSLAALRGMQPVPLLIFASDGDRRMRPEIARRLHEESRSAIKKLKVFGEEVPHGASARIYPDVYASILLSFLEEGLGEIPVPRADGPAVRSSNGTTSSPK
jgi:pimeloyl-ACP methyl ester carboxylesterase